jgi:hypothetical protein
MPRSVVRKFRSGLPILITESKRDFASLLPAESARSESRAKRFKY